MTTVSTGVTVKDDPNGYLHALVLDTETEHDSEPDESGSIGKLAAAIFAKISPDDYGPLLLAALEPATVEIVDSYLDYAENAEWSVVDEGSHLVGHLEQAGHDTHGGHVALVDGVGFFLYRHRDHEYEVTVTDVTERGEEEDHPDCEMDTDMAIFATRVAIIERQLEVMDLRFMPNDNTEPGGTWLIVDQDDHTVAGGHAGLTLSQAEAWIAHHPGYPGVPVAEGTALAREILRVHEPEALRS